MINKIYIIESIPDNEIQTGKKLYDQIIVNCNNKYSSKIEHQYSSLNDRESFFETLKLIENNSKLGDEIIIHIEVHGNDSEMGLKNNESVSWDELTEKLIPINKILKNNLHINIVACFSMHIGLSINLKSTAPYKSYISTLEKITPNEISADNKVIYEKIFEFREIYKAYVEFYKINQNSKFKIKDINTVLEYHIKPHLNLFLNSGSLGFLKSFFDSYLNININIVELNQTDNKIDYIFSQFKKRFEYNE